MGTIQRQRFRQGAGVFAPVLHLWDEALTRYDDKRANRWPLHLQPNRRSRLPDVD